MQLRQQARHREKQHSKDDAAYDDEFHRYIVEDRWLVVNTPKGEPKGANGAFDRFWLPTPSRELSPWGGTHGRSAGTARNGGASPLVGRALSISRMPIRPRFTARQPFLRVAAEKFLDGSRGRVFERRRRFLFDAPAHARKREPVAEHQLLDAEHSLDIDPPVDSRPAGRFRDAQIGKFRLPRTQHVRLHAGDLAHLGRLEQRALGNLDVGHKQSCLLQVAGEYSTREPNEPYELDEPDEPNEPSTNC